MLIPVLRTLATHTYRHRWELVAVLVLVAVAGEVYLRLPVGRQLEYQPDEELGGVLAPGQWTVGERVNRDGHRGRDTDWSRPVILAVGDSQGWGAGVADEQVWTARLEQQLRRERDYATFQVVNASHPGHGPYHQYLRARRVFEKHAVDVMIVRVSLEDWSFTPTPARELPELVEAARARQSLRRYTKFVPFLAKKGQEQLTSIRATVSLPQGDVETPSAEEKGRLMWETHGRWWEKLTELAAEHEVPVVFYLHDPTDLPGSAVLHNRLRGLARAYPGVHVLRLGSEVYGLRGASPEEVYRDYRARFTLPHDAHANARQHELIGRTVHSFLTEGGLLATAQVRRQVLHAER
ncbi:MAG: hypothetical protein L0Z62_20435 [Gemmataceae bacterium]|nr:hypothetical protein [Gemmataceae bacterium]